MRTTIRKATEPVDDSIPLSKMEVGVRYVVADLTGVTVWTVGDFVFRDQCDGSVRNPSTGGRLDDKHYRDVRVRRIPDDEVVEIHA